jgi:DNA-binding NarL/FixJ family response regulator
MRRRTAIAVPDPETRTAVGTLGVLIEARPYREAIIRSLLAEPSLVLVDLGGGDAASIDRLLQLKSGVALIDLPSGQADSVIRHVRRAGSRVHMVAMNSGDHVEEILSLFESGFTGCVPRNGSLEDVVVAVRAALRNESFCSPQVVAALVHRLIEIGPRHGGRGGRTRLSIREADVIRFIEEGLTNKEIASRLGIEHSTARNHVHNILKKLDARGRREAVSKFHSLKQGSRE